MNNGSTVSSMVAPAHERLPSHVCDVWSHWGNRYRTRALVSLAINAVLFAGVGAFAFWIRTGTYFAPTMQGYWNEFVQTFSFVGNTHRVLGSMLLEPISVQDVPMQIPILGLLMAALIAIPILVSLLFRFWASVPFVAIVGFVAVMPWLAITLLGSCIIASVKPFRSRYPFMSALLGTLPAVAYLVFAYEGTADLVAGRIDPVDRVKYFAPWVLAIVAATIVYAIVLTISRMVSYRPGAITPLLCIMFCAPVVLFEYHVGRDELDYRLLERLNRHHFEDVDASVEFSRRAEIEWERHPLPRPSFEELERRLEVLWTFEFGSDLGPYHTELARNQTEIHARCAQFLHEHPGSRYAPNVLYIQARAFDMRVAPAEFRQTRWIRFYDDFPSEASRPWWVILLDNSRDTVLGAVAELRLAQLEARDGEVERAVDRLRRSAAILGRLRPTHAMDATTSVGGGGALVRRPIDRGLQVPVDRLWLETNRLLDLITKNADPIYGFDPLHGPRRAGERPTFGWLDLDPRHDRYADNLAQLRAAYPNAQVSDNLDVEIARITPEPRKRIELLEACVARHPQSDAAPAALFQLAFAYRAADRSPKAQACLERLMSEFPASVWAHEARGYSRGAMVMDDSDDRSTKESPL